MLPKYGKSNDMNMPLNNYGMNVIMVRGMYEDLIDSIIADECKYSTVNIEFK